MLLVCSVYSDLSNLCVQVEVFRFEQSQILQTLQAANKDCTN